MKTKAARLYGKDDIRIEEFKLAPLKDDEIRVKNITDSICMSSYKAVKQGTDHTRVPDDIAENPIILGHEICGEIVEVGKKWEGKYNVGDKFVVQPAHNKDGSLMAPGYSYTQYGGNATYGNMPAEIMEMDCLLPYTGEAFFLGSLAEPVSTVIGGFNSLYHHKEKGSYEHVMGMKEGGNLAMIASVGPMGLSAIAYIFAMAIEGKKAKRVLITDIDQARLDRAESIYTPAKAKELGFELKYMNTSGPNSFDDMMAFTDGEGYDDVFVLAPVPALVKQAQQLLRYDGCFNFFAGPSDSNFLVEMNMYDVHYANHHFVGNSGGNNDDLREAVRLLSEGKLDVAPMITHILGLEDVGYVTQNVPDIPGGKKLVYPHCDIELTAIEDFAEKGKTDPRFADLAEIMSRSNQIWNAEAEQYVMKNFASK
ncbi:MAG: zinc-binding dehydrogenase [Clostridiaceae bacterium]|nr:zinc-binding dehydrogenase [Clostridiaceae bacterium]